MINTNSLSRNASYFQRKSPLESDDERRTTILPFVGSSVTQKSFANRRDHQSLSGTTTPSDDGSKPHWTKQVLVPTINLVEDESQSPRKEQSRPQSPNVEQIAERNQPSTPPPASSASKGKKRSAAGN